MTSGTRSMRCAVLPSSRPQTTSVLSSSVPLPSLTASSLAEQVGDLRRVPGVDRLELRAAVAAVVRHRVVPARVAEPGVRDVAEAVRELQRRDARHVARERARP